MSDHQVVILSSPHHPLYHRCKDSGLPFFDIQSQEIFDEKKTSLSQATGIWDFTLPSKDKKQAFLDKLGRYFEVPVFSDLSLYWGDAMMKVFPHLKGGFAAAFASEAYPKCEIAIEEKYHDQGNWLFSRLGLTPTFVKSPGLGFRFPRILSMIINEAYFALEEGVATKEDIDRAMLYGVNYPKGPFAWGQEIGLDKVVMLLEELHYFTKQSRYRISQQLKLESLKGSPS